MKQRLPFLLSGLVLLLAGIGISAGCIKRKVNKSQPQLQATVRVSLASAGDEGTRDSIADSIGVSNDGRYVAFTSKADNLVAGDSNNLSDVFLRDNHSRSLILISVSRVGGAATGASGSPSISGDGRYVVFASVAPDLTFDVLPVGKKQIYVRDVLLNTTTLVSRGPNAAGLIATLDCNNPKISNDGVYVVFDSAASNLDGDATFGDDPSTDTRIDIWRRKVIDGTSAFPTELISFASGSAPAPIGGPKGDGDSQRPVISGDGRFVAFESESINLVAAGQDGAPDNNANTDVFVRDTQTNRTVRVSSEYSGAPTSPSTLDGPSRAAAISLDGQFIAFRSTAGTLSIIAQETNPNIYVRFMDWGASTPAPFTEVLSVHTSGATGGFNCDKPTISGDGTKIAWQSLSSALVNGDSNGVSDIFLRDRTAQLTSRESVHTFGGQLDGNSALPFYSPDGRYIVFWSQATNGVDDDTNGAADIYMRGPPLK